MSKSARIRKNHAQQRQAAQQTIRQPTVNKALNAEINKQLADAEKRFFNDEIAVILWVLHEVFGFGPVRLKRFYDEYSSQADKLRDWYAVSDSDMPWLCREKLKQIGVDLDEWENEKEVNSNGNE